MENTIYFVIEKNENNYDTLYAIVNGERIKVPNVGEVNINIGGYLKTTTIVLREGLDGKK